MANVTEPLWEPGLQTGRSGAIQAETVLAGEHLRQKLRETSKTKDPGHRQLRISSRLPPAVRCIEHRRDSACQDRTIRRMSRGCPTDWNHYRKLPGKQGSVERYWHAATHTTLQGKVVMDKRVTGHVHTMSSYPVVGTPREDRKGHMQRLPSTRRDTAG